MRQDLILMRQIADFESSSWWMRTQNLRVGFWNSRSRVSKS